MEEFIKRWESFKAHLQETNDLDDDDLEMFENVYFLGAIAMYGRTQELLLSGNGQAFMEMEQPLVARAFQIAADKSTRH